MLRVVRRSISLANAPSLTESELGQRAKDWAEMLGDIVPEERLMDAFMRAARDHDSAFPVSAYEVRDAWRRLDEEERTAAKEAEQAKKRRDPVANCPNAHNHDNEHGDVTIYLGFPPAGREVVVPCQTCRPEASSIRLAEVRGKYQTVPAENQILNAVVSLQRPTHYTPPETALEILARAKADATKPEAVHTLMGAMFYVRDMDKTNF